MVAWTGKTSRRGFLLSSVTTASFATGFTALERVTRPAEHLTAQALPPIPTGSEGQALTGNIIALAIEGDIILPDAAAVGGTVTMQTNGYVLRIDLAVPSTTIDPQKIILHVEDQGHDTSGNITLVKRTIEAARVLFGPVGKDLGEVIGAQRLLLALSDSLFRQDSQWFTRIEKIVFQSGWMIGASAAEVTGSSIERRDSRAYPPFPVQPLTPPFQRLTPGNALRFEIAGANEFGREGRMFARAEAWLHGAGVDGPVAIASNMEVSALCPAGSSPSGIPAPVFALNVDCGNVPEGEAEIRYRVLPFIGPPWDSRTHGRPFPALGPVVGVPACVDRSDSWSPLFGVVSNNGTGLPSTDTRGLARDMAAALASGLVYRDVAAVASAARLVNRSAVALPIAGEAYRRQVPHDDIASGVAVLPPVVGSVPGQNSGAYIVRTGMANQATFPPGATCFEIRSPSGLPEPNVRLRGVDASNLPATAGSKAVPSRLLLRGIWIDGTGLTGTAHIALDGTTAGAATSALHPRNFAYMITQDCRISENPAAGSAAPARWRSGFVWDIRLRHDGVSGVQALGVTSSFSGIVATVGSHYERPTALSGLVMCAVVGTRLRNIGVRDADRTARVVPMSRLLLNARFDFDVAFTSPMIALGSSWPSTGGLGIVNVMCRGSVASGGPIMQISADSSLQSVDNLVLQYFSHDNVSARLSDGRCNILYQDHAYISVDKIGSMRFCAFKSYNIKGDNFQQRSGPERVSVAYNANGTYAKGALVHDSAGTASASSTFFQARRDITTAMGQWAPLSDGNAWQRVGQMFGIHVGEEAGRQGNACFRYGVGSWGNVAASTFNSDLPGALSGYGFQWGVGGAVAANFATFFVSPAGNDYRPGPGSPLLGRVPVGQATVPIDLAGTARRNDGMGAAGAYEAG